MATWTDRARAGRLPLVDRTGTVKTFDRQPADSVADILSNSVESVRVDTRGGTYTVADLQRAYAREIGR